MRILILGAGGQGQTLADALRFAVEAGQAVKPIGYLDDDPQLWGASLVGLPVLGPFSMLSELAPDGLLLGIGSNRLRAELFHHFTKSGYSFFTLIHPRAMVAHDVSVGVGSYVGPHVVLAAGTSVGVNAIVHANSVIGHHNAIGDHVHAAPGVLTAGAVTIGKGALVGIGARIIPQKTIGEWAVVGAGAVVIRDVASGQTVAGNPAAPLPQKKATVL